MSEKLDVVLGLQWGDEGKGKIVDVLASRYPAVARFECRPFPPLRREKFRGEKHPFRNIP